MPQFQSRVVVAVQARPPMTRAVQAVALTWAKGGGPLLRASSGLETQRLSSQGPRTQTESMRVPARMVYALTMGAERV